MFRDLFLDDMKYKTIRGRYVWIVPSSWRLLLPTFPRIEIHLTPKRSASNSEAKDKVLLGSGTVKSLIGLWRVVRPEGGLIPPQGHTIKRPRMPLPLIQSSCESPCCEHRLRQGSALSSRY